MNQSSKGSPKQGDSTATTLGLPESAMALAQRVGARLGLSFPTSPIELERSFLDPIRRNAFFVAKLPSLAFFGIGISKLTAKACDVDLPFTWRTQNPFQSVYFAAQAAAAELSTGALVLRAIAGRERMSMLVIEMKGEFSKKAKADIVFTCEDGDAIHAAAEKAESGEEVKVQAVAVGRLMGGADKGAEVSRFTILWSIKKKS